MPRRASLDGLDGARAIQRMIDLMARGKSIEEIVELCEKQFGENRAGEVKDGRAIDRPH